MAKQSTVTLRFRALVAVCVLAAAGFGLGLSGPAGAGTTGAPAASGVLGPLRAACGPAATGHARCLAVFRASAPASGGYGPADLVSAYGLPSATAGAGRVVAIVDAMDDPNIEADLGVYRQAYGLPACTAASGCFRKVDQRGGHSYPSADSGWGLEESLDVQMVSAVCPRCRILLVEADDATEQNLALAEDTAVRLGATAISNSYGGPEDPSQLTDFDPHYHHPGVAITAAAGDTGYGVDYPASSPYVTAVGGTTLTRANNGRGWSETVWGGTGGGCSAYEPKPAWQHDGACVHRTVADVAAVADLNTGVAVYDSFTQTPIDPNGWIVVGGTSVSSPIVASVYALNGDVVSLRAPGAALAYARSSQLHDVVSGSNDPSLVDATLFTLDYLQMGGLSGGQVTDVPIVKRVANPCPGGYLCNARRGYDSPTGLGTPAGIAAF